ncbi:MAG TPA: DUF6458 family protein [Jiangellaceae bacterium]
MGIGLGTFLIALGLVLALGVRDRLADFDLSVIGWILAGVGALSLVVTLMVNAGRTRRTEIVEHRDDGVDGL